MSVNLSARAQMAEEISFDSSTLTGFPTYDVMDTVLLFNPLIIIFDNQSNTTIGIGNNGTTTWKTFVEGEALILDLRAAHGKAENLFFRIGMGFYAIGTAGVGDFKISYIYAEI